MGKKVKIIIACGSGIATSTIAADTVKTICKEEGIDCEIIKCRIYELSSRAKSKEVDIVLSTGKIDESQFEKPSMSVIGLISGVNENKIRADLAQMLHKIADEK